MEEQLPEGVDLSIAWEGVDNMPILFANQFSGQVGQQSEVLLTFGQLAPPIILGETQEERVRHARGLTHISVKPIARVAMTRAGLEELVGVLHKTIENHDKAQELLARAKRMAEGGDE